MRKLGNSIGQVRNCVDGLSQSPFVEVHVHWACYLEPYEPPSLILPASGSISRVPPAKDAGRSLARSRTKYGLDPVGKVKRSSPARRVAVASILMLLSRVRLKYPGEASVWSLHKISSFTRALSGTYRQCFSCGDAGEKVAWWYMTQILLDIEVEEFRSFHRCLRAHENTK